MSRNPICCTWAGCTVIALATLTAPDVFAEDNKATPPVTVAEASTPDVGAPRRVVPADPFPAHERGVRQAAAQGNEPLRRYIWRTRMIHNFYFNDFALKD
jgi:hypothetical protein